jgi:hypothetical protein
LPGITWGNVRRPVGASLPGWQGGSPRSDWDLGLYYRGGVDTGAIRARDEKRVGTGLPVRGAGGGVRRVVGRMQPIGFTTG